MNSRRISQLLAALLLIGLIANWRLVVWAFSIREPIGLFVGITWLALVIAALVGLSTVRRWGAYTLLVLAVFSTIALSTPLFPGMHPLGLKGPIALAFWNLVPLVGAVALLRLRRKPEIPH
jgi:hypothetical protein